MEGGVGEAECRVVDCLMVDTEKKTVAAQHRHRRQGVVQQLHTPDAVQTGKYRRKNHRTPMDTFPVTCVPSMPHCPTHTLVFALLTKALPLPIRRISLP